MSGKMKTTRYQIQQGLTLIDNSGRPVDFRALVQKNRTGKWSVTSIVARIAGGSHYVSNLARGGSLSTVKDAVAKTQLSGSAKASAYAGLHTAHWISLKESRVPSLLILVNSVLIWPWTPLGAYGRRSQLQTIQE